MKGQPSNRANDAKIVDMVSDHPGIRCNAIAEKLGMATNTIATKIKRLTDESRIFRQKQGMGGSSGYIYNLFTVHYAKKHNIPRIYKGVNDEKNTLELQKMYHRLILGVA